ncbi:hypothetical protein F5B21DRAFT_508187 [Xylaria acuta]|nr:hypothetical protein F5B21DRAFT_508187 [Xylaria acuta]
MCKKVFIVSLLCECKRCINAKSWDFEHEEYYPHYGSHVVDDDCDTNRGFSYQSVKKEDACSSVILDKQGHYESCDNPPDVVETDEKWATANGDEHGKRFCEECLKVCMVLRKDEDISQGLDQLEVSD